MLGLKDSHEYKLPFVPLSLVVQEISPSAFSCGRNYMWISEMIDDSVKQRRDNDKTVHFQYWYKEVAKTF